MTRTAPHRFTPPFEIYHDGIHISDQDGHVCSAENPEIAQALLEVMNGFPVLADRLQQAEATLALESLGIDTHQTMVEVARETMAKLVAAEKRIAVLEAAARKIAFPYCEER